MASFIPPYSKSFTERLERVNQLRALRRSDPLDERSKGKALVHGKDDRHNKDVNMSRFAELLPHKTQLCRSVTDTLLASMSAKLSGRESPHKAPVWERLSASSHPAPHQHHATPRSKFWLPNGKAGTQCATHFEEMGAIRDRSPHRRHNRLGSKRLAVTKRFKKAERRSVGNESSGSRPASSPLGFKTPQPPQAQQQLPRQPPQATPTLSEEEPLGAPKAERRHLVIPVTVACARPQSEIHAILAVSPLASRQELLECVCVQLHLRPPRDPAYAGSGAGTGAGTGAGSGAGSGLLRPPRSRSPHATVNSSFSSSINIISNSNSNGNSNSNSNSNRSSSSSNAGGEDRLPTVLDVALFSEGGYLQEERSARLLDGTLPPFPFSAAGGFEQCSRVVVRVQQLAQPGQARASPSPTRAGSSGKCRAESVGIPS